MKNKAHLLLLFLLLFSNSLYSQEAGMVSGKILDEQGEGLISATVLVKGTNTGTKTDFDGNFKIPNIPLNSILTISYVGYKKKEFPLNGQPNVKIVMEVLAASGKEVVVIGYGTQRKEDATGAVQSVSSKEFNGGVILSPEQLLAGKSPGVVVTSESGVPGGKSTVRIRGGTSINAGNDPLYVIDGVPIDNADNYNVGKNPLNSMNTNDIENITVLKDASATAIYGSRGANGVIIITTKRGEKPLEAGKAVHKFSYSGYVSVNIPGTMVKVMDATTFRNTVNAKADNSTIALLNKDASVTTDWQSQIFRVALAHSHNLSYSGGMDKSSYRISLGYTYQDGILITSSTEKINLSANVNSLVFDDKLEITSNIKGSYNKDRLANSGAIADAVTFDPTQPVKDPTSAWGGYYEYASSNGPKNPVSTLLQTQDYMEVFRSIGNIEAKYKFHFFPNLSIKTNLAYDITAGNHMTFLPSTLRSEETIKGEVTRESVFRVSKLLDVYLNYEQDFKEIYSRISALAGYSYQDFLWEFDKFRSYNLNSDVFGLNSTSPAANSETTITKEGNKLASFFGRVNYAFQDKYLLTVNFRADASSRFSPSFQWGYFPSAALAWQLLKEDFMKPATDVLSELKVRFGYGITGNQDIGNYKYLSTYSAGDIKVQYPFGTTFVSTILPIGATNDLKWEQTSQYNAGIDFGFLDGRIRGGIDVYYKLTTDLLAIVTDPQPTLSNRILRNVGSVQNMGVELNISAFVLSPSDINNENISWNLNFSASFNDNKVLSLDKNGSGVTGYLVGGISGGVGNTIQIIKPGYAINSFYVYEHKRDAYGRPTNNLNDVDNYVDQNKDGKIDDNDKVIKKSPAPIVMMGLTSVLQIYDLDIVFTFRANIGNYVYNNTYSVITNYGEQLGALGKPRNMSAIQNNIQFQSAQYFSDYFLEDASFLRLDNITVGYTFKVPETKYSMRVYVTGQNLFVLTGYRGLDPENTGIDNNLYPRSRGVLVGLNINL